MKVIIISNILLVEGKLTPSCSRTQITYSFNVPKGCSTLKARFTYWPKELEDESETKRLINEGLTKYVDKKALEIYKKNWKSFAPLKNLVTISLDDTNQFRGAGHRHSSDQYYIISADEASPGLVKGEIIPGVWKITISVHCIITVNCDYKLQVWNGDGVN